jgi:cytidylate kinase
MQNKHTITISGRPGSGKSTTAKALAGSLGYPHFSSGDLFRLLAKERGVDVLQANLTAEQNAEIDHLVDARLQEIGEQDNELVIDSRMAWHWMPRSFKVFLDLDLVIAAERILGSLNDARMAHENIPNDPAEYAKELEERLASETRRYKALYDANPYDMTQYDLVIDTAQHSIAEVEQMVLAGFKQWIGETA